MVLNGTVLGPLQYVKQIIDWHHLWTTKVKISKKFTRGLVWPSIVPRFLEHGIVNTLVVVDLIHPEAI